MRKVIILSVAALVAAFSFGQNIIPSSFSPDGGFWYSPSVIYENGTWTMWATASDTVWRYVSYDGVHWTDGRVVLSAVVGGWEDDGNWLISGQKDPTGISDPRVIRLPSGSYLMAYSGGPTNTLTKGGIGIAVSQDGIVWERPPWGRIIYLPGGFSIVGSLLQIDEHIWLYFMTGIVRPVPQRVELDAAGKPAGAVQVLAMPWVWEPLAYDSEGFWSVVATDNGDPLYGPPWFEIYKGGDGVSTLGTLVGRIDQSVTGKIANFLPGIRDRGPQGQYLGGPVVIFGAGDAWATWRPMMASVGPQSATPVPMIPLPPEHVTASWLGNCIQVRWQESIGAMGYAVLRSDKSNYLFARYLMGSLFLGNSFTDCTVVPGQRYWYWIESYGPGGTCYCWTNSATPPNVRRHLKESK